MAAIRFKEGVSWNSGFGKTVKAIAGSRQRRGNGGTFLSGAAQR